MVEKGENVWIPVSAKETLLEDESALLQLGQTSESTFYGLTFWNPEPSTWVDFPTPEHPDNKMEYASLYISLDDKKTKWSRQTYSLLDFLGDLGGLFDALKLIVASIVGPFARFGLNLSIISGVYTRLK